MKQIIRAELYYLVRSKKLWIYLGIFGFCSAVNIIMGGIPYVDLALFVIDTLVVADLFHKDQDRTTLKNLAGSGYSYRQIFLAKSACALLVCGSLLTFTTLFSIPFRLKTGLTLGVTREIMKYLCALANLVLILIVGEATSSVAGTIVGGIALTGLLPMVLGMGSLADNAFGALCRALSPYTLGSIENHPYPQCMTEYLITAAVIAGLYLLCAVRYEKKHSS